MSCRLWSPFRGLSCFWREAGGPGQRAETPAAPASQHIQSSLPATPPTGGHPISQNLQEGGRPSPAKLAHVALALSFLAGKGAWVGYLERPHLPAGQGGSASRGDRRGRDEGMTAVPVWDARADLTENLLWVRGQSHHCLSWGGGRGRRVQGLFGCFLKFCLLLAWLWSGTRKLPAWLTGWRREGAGRGWRSRCLSPCHREEGQPRDRPVLALTCTGGADTWVSQPCGPECHPPSLLEAPGIKCSMWVFFFFL